MLSMLKLEPAEAGILGQMEKFLTKFGLPIASPCQPTSLLTLSLGAGTGYQPPPFPPWTQCCLGVTQQGRGWEPNQNKLTLLNSDSDSASHLLQLHLVLASQASALPVQMGTSHQWLKQERADSDCVIQMVISLGQQIKSLSAPTMPLPWLTQKHACDEAAHGPQKAGCFSL